MTCKIYGTCELRNSPLYNKVPLPEYEITFCNEFSEKGKAKQCFYGMTLEKIEILKIKARVDKVQRLMGL